MKRFGLIGHPIEHSLSPALFAAAYGKEHSYDLISGEMFEESYNRFLQEYDAVNVTAPFKEEACSKADVRSPECDVIGACNVLKKTGEGVLAANTDYLGVMQCLIPFYADLRLSPVTLVVGCGGAGKAAAYAACELGNQVVILNRTYEKAEAFVEKLDSLFTVSSELHGPNPAPDITGRIGQYAHGNEPGHHTLYIYNYIGQPWKAQRRISDILYTLYNTNHYGMCGNDDCGQMSAWYVMSAMGFYPMTHGQGVYCIGTPIFKDVELRHKKGVLRIKADGASRENCYVQSVTLNGKPYPHNYLMHDELFSGNCTISFQMGNTPNKAWGSAKENRPPSMSDEIGE